MENSIIMPQSPALTKTKRGYLSLEDADWQKAAEFFDEALDLDPEYAYAYLGLLCAELKISGEAGLNDQKTPFTDGPNFKKAVRFADEELKERLERYIVKNTAVSVGAKDVKSAEIGDIVRFGEYDWRVLDIKNGSALIITEDIIDQLAYHNTNTGITWENCDLREYLNGGFYNKFSPEDKAKIIQVTNKNLNNPWFDTSGGSDTEDYVFLLSLEEVCTLFGDSSALLNDKGDRIENVVNDANNGRRIAKIEGTDHWWWLRSPGNHNDDELFAYSNTAAAVFADGVVNVDGHTVDSKYDGVRPAMWVSLS